MNDVQIQNWTLEQIEALQTALGRYREVMQTQQARSKAIENLARAARRAAEVYRAELHGAGQPNDPVLNALEQTARQRQEELLTLQQGIDAAAQEVNQWLAGCLPAKGISPEPETQERKSERPIESQPLLLPLPEPAVSPLIEQAPLEVLDKLPPEPEPVLAPAGAALEMDPGEDVDELWESVIRSGNPAPFGEG